MGVKEIDKRMRHLEKAVAAELSRSQRRWFDAHLAAGRPGQALTSLARWTAASGSTIPPEVRGQFASIAASLEMEGLVMPILDAGDGCAHRRIDPPTGVGAPPATDADVPVPAGPPPAAAGPPHGKAGFDVPLARFEEFVSDAIDSVPDRLRMAMDNVVVMVEEEAEGPPLFGLYVGVPLTKRTSWGSAPDRIFIYRRTICAHSRTEDEVRDQVHRTVVHEIAHHFGISDPRLRELGW